MDTPFFYVRVRKTAEKSFFRRDYSTVYDQQGIILPILRVKLSAGVTSHPYLLEIEGLFTQGCRPGRTVGESVGGIFGMDSSDWSNGIRYHTFDTRPDTEFKPQSQVTRVTSR